MLDNALRLASAQAFSASGATSQYLDQSQAKNLGDGEPLCMLFTVTAAGNYTANETYTFAIQAASTSAFSSPTTLESRTIASAASNNPLAVGAQVALVLPPCVSDAEFLQGYLTLAGTTPTISVDCDILPLSAVRKEAFYPAGFTVK